MKRDFILKRTKVGEILVRQGRITPEQLTACLRIQKQTSKPLGQILLEEDILDAEELTHVLAEQLGIPHVWLRKGLVDPRIVHILPKEKALLFQAIPMFRVNNVLTVATADPHAFFVFDEIAKITNMQIQPVLSRTDDIIEAIHECYQEEVSIDEVMASIDESGIEVVDTAPDREISEIAELAEGSPVINLTNMILLRAIRDGASDIHIEPQPQKLRVRVRIDSVLYELMSPKIEMHPAVVSRLKIMAKLDIAERRIPQDGRIQVNVDGRTVDIRFSSMPGIHGEKVVLRILDKSKVILDINKLGLDPTVLNRFKSLLRRSHGLIIVCGPTGSGKSTTLYSAITMLNTPEKNIITIEDPVEYQLESINQNQVKEAIGLTFAKFLKHALRQDPDIVMVGEIRDRETAEIAIQASLTGHLVLSTLHANDSPSVITRLLEMGVEPYLISSSLLASLAQRLVRTICPECKTSYYAPKEVMQELGSDENEQSRLSRGKGCSDCYDSGFKGRIGTYELLEMDDGLRSLTLNTPTIDALQKYLKEHDHRGLKELGYEKVLQGVTTIEEVKRVTSVEM
ncbi:MAG: Flp pilus assembly complex ATPase component TadA [Deltaproteobacteria bacterium]|nr:Flp pilus assembly complex ATPase component TadA [Deltaproteobacteria bacterium]